MLKVMHEKDHYLSAFEEFEKDQSASAPFVRRLRKAAVARFGEVGFPTARNEDWKFTSVAPLVKVPFRLAGLGGDVPAAALRRFTLPDCHQLVFVNGHYAPELSSPPAAAGVTIGSLATALRDRPDQVEPYLARHARYEDQTFPALNTAFLRDGAFVFVPDGTRVEKPIHLLFLGAAPAEPTVSHPRTLLVVGRDGQVSLVESYVGPEGGRYFTNAVTEVVAGENAVIDHYKLQHEGPEAFHVAVTQVHQSRRSNVSSHYLGFGGSLVRNEARTVLDAEGCECTFNGLYVAGGTQHMDNYTVIDHAKPHCASHELYKGILGGKAHGVFNGKIFVRPDAQKTDAKQTNQTLLLSDDATINTKPQLEIYADDVKCTHGATVGNLNADAVFYLRSRGIGEAAARALLTFAFANDVIDRIQVESLRRRLADQLLAAQHLPTDQAEEVS